MHGPNVMAPAQVKAAIRPRTRCPVRRSRPPAPDPASSAQSGQRRKPAASRDGGVHASRIPPARSFTGGRRIRPVENRTIPRHPPGRAPIMISGRRRLPRNLVEKPGCLTTPAPPFPVRSEPRARARGPSGSGLTRGLGSPREISNGYAGSCLRIRLTAPAPGLLLRLTTVPDHALAQVSHIRWFFG
jgi:hypothetical protein